MGTKKLKLADVWAFNDPRDIPAYSISEAAHYLCMPKATLRAWVMGSVYKTPSGRTRQFRSVITLPYPDTSLLSFFNLAEAHVLRALRTRHSVQLPVIRRALKYVQEKFSWKRPLLQQDFKTDGVRLFIERLGQLEEASAGGQLVMKDVMAHLERLEWEDDLVARLYPFTRNNMLDAPKSVFIDPRYSFGRPILRECRVATSVIAERYKAGDSIQVLASDYGCSTLEIEEGVRCELRISQAA